MRVPLDNFTSTIYNESTARTRKSGWATVACRLCVPVGLRSAYSMTADQAARTVRRRCREGTPRRGLCGRPGRQRDEIGLWRRIDQVNNVLKGAGYAASEVDKFFGKAGEEIKKGVEKLDPTKW